MFIERKRLLAPGQRVLVGTGGGAASLGLVSLLVSLRERLRLADVAVASVETSVDETSDAAERVAEVGRVVRQLGVTFHAVRPSSLHRGRVRVARELVALAREQGFDRVAVGHTRDDHVLAVLEGALSGGGLARMGGVAPRVKGGLVRPLLCLSAGEAMGLAHGVEALPLEPPEPGRGPTRKEALRGVLQRLRVVAPGVDAALASVGQEARTLQRRIRGEARQRVAAGRRGEQSFEIALNAAGEWWWPRVAEAIAAELLRECGVVGLGSRERDVAAQALTRMLRAEDRRAKTPTLLVSGLSATYAGGDEVVRVRGPSRTQKRREAGG